jgi:hypothetical protein
MTEKQMQSFWGAYIKRHLRLESEAYELKITKNNSIPFEALKEHQVDALLRVEQKGLYHRITDQPWMKDRPNTYTLKKPFDCFCLVKAKGYVIIWFYKPRKRRVFYKISINEFLQAKMSSEHKSLTEHEAFMICDSAINVSLL